jgi:hypothetical protein
MPGRGVTLPVGMPSCLLPRPKPRTTFPLTHTGLSCGPSPRCRWLGVALPTAAVLLLLSVGCGPSISRSCLGLLRGADGPSVVLRFSF